MRHKLTWLIILVLGIFNLALADTIISPGGPRYTVLPKILESGTKNELNKHKSIRITKAANATRLEVGNVPKLIAGKTAQNIASIRIIENFRGALTPNGKFRLILPVSSGFVWVPVVPTVPTELVEGETGTKLTEEVDKDSFNSSDSNFSMQDNWQFRIETLFKRNDTLLVKVPPNKSTGATIVPIKGLKVNVPVSTGNQELKVTIVDGDMVGMDESGVTEAEAVIGYITEFKAAFTISPNQGNAPLTVQLDASASRDYEYRVQYQWTSSDGQTADGVQTSMTFSQVGTYNITLTVTDNLGAKASTTQSVTVIKPNQPPQATFSINPNTGLAPLTVQLDASTSTDDENIVKYQWTSSDGQSAEGIKTSLTFSQVGTHNITLTITDNEGATASSSQTVTVNEKPSTSDSIGQAIIIAAGGAQPNNTLYPYSNEYTQRFYRILKERGFKDEDIAYMNPQPPDINLDGRLENDLLDYELFEPESELKKAFQQAANNLTAGQQFIFFLHGHARQDYFRIMDNYELSATYLRDLLAMLPANIQQILILDSCYSGSFFDELMAPNRILISSADNQTQAWNNKSTI
jgi:PKD repeat protein